MSGDMRRGRRRRLEPSRIQYGAWDDPRVSLFATVPQEPLGDMLGRLKRLPQTNRNRAVEVDACPLVLAQSSSTNRLYREVKYQVQQIADDRNRNYHPIQERERQSALIARMMAEHNRREFAEAMRRKQLHTNSQRLRDLATEIDRAKTTLSVVKKRNDNIDMHGVERAQERKEALADREQVRQEKLAEQLALQKKAQTYSEQLVEQIHKLQAQREQQQMTDMEEGRQKRHNDELAHATDLQQSIEWRHKKRLELKQMLDEFSALQRSIREANPMEPDKLDVIVMEALGPVTASFLRQELQRRVDDIERRRLISDSLGQELSEMRSKKDAHDNMLADILACERQAREKKRAHQDIEKRENQKQQVAKDLINQQKEQQFYLEKDAALTKITRDSTSFMERQYQQAADREAISHAMNLSSYEGIAADIVNNVRLRAAAVEEERMIKQALHDMEADMERRVDEERMRVLHAQARDIIDEVRPCKLSQVERQAFGLPACGLHDTDIHNTHTT
ncbi:calponin homology domain-containing protein DDB_G0272472 [Drosophila innubila]|uniref:calponin homology domain-containing protein DDB_G0272472 n=1 Tax=Drosophila innubila TaxID=198719 RepID=UPI00148B8A31|nr:calponin homology domain-containing protein DDB_G0272472 [Drosophila innubila]